MKSNIKLSFILAIAIIFQSNIKAQLSVAPSGSTTINANITDWGSGLRVTVPTVNGCAFHLNYAGVDRFWVVAQGIAWAQQGYWQGSDYTLKKNISKINTPLSTLLKLNGVQYKYKDDDQSNGQRLGFIAQDVEKILPGLVKTLPDSTKGISYTDLTALLVEAIKEQQVQIETLKKQINGTYNSDSFKSASDQKVVESTESIALAYLEQNSPNPFTQSTEIKYYLPDVIQNATLYIYDMNGTQIKNIPVTSFGNSYITIYGSELKAGMYMYTLIADGKVIGTKQMILTD